MEPSTQPSDIAREAVKRLATRKQPPTPDYFRRAYHEAQGLAPATPAWPEAIRAEDDHEFLTGLRQVLALLFANLGEPVSEDADCPARWRPWESHRPIYCAGPMRSCTRPRPSAATGSSAAEPGPAGRQ